MSLPTRKYFLIYCKSRTNKKHLSRNPPHLQWTLDVSLSLFLKTWVFVCVLIISPKANVWRGAQQRLKYRWSSVATVLILLYTLKKQACLIPEKKRMYKNIKKVLWAATRCLYRTVKLIWDLGDYELKQKRNTYLRVQFSPSLNYMFWS